MEFRELLPRRRMVRHYAPEPVPREAVERIVATVRRAPSAGYSQGQRLLVVTEGRGAPSSRDHGRRGVDDRRTTASRGSRALRCTSSSCTREDDYHERYRKEDKLDATRRGDRLAGPVLVRRRRRALMLLLLAAIDEGLAAGVTGVEGAAAAQIRRAVRHSADVAIVALVTIGVAAPDPGWSAVTSRRTQPRRAPAESVRWESWEG